jgi:uncharacterized protein YqjF (DUF2071 family)
MTAGTVRCVIERRLLVNYAIEPDLVARLLPPPFRPQLAGGMAVGGVCFIRLGELRAGRLPAVPGLATENAAHRFAVEWDDADGTRAGVYVPRRDTGSRLAAAAGGRVFPGRYRLACFTVDETGGHIAIAVRSRDGQVRLDVQAVPASTLSSQLFPSLGAAAEFFRRGALGFSPSAAGSDLDGVRLDAASWAMQPMTAQIRSTLFDDPAHFPAGSCTVDSALLMRNLPATWATAGQLSTRVAAPRRAAASPAGSAKSSGRTSTGVPLTARRGCPVSVRTVRPAASSSRAIAAPE